MHIVHIEISARPDFFLSHPFLGKSRNRQSNLDAGTKMNFDVGAAKRQLRLFCSDLQDSLNSALVEDEMGDQKVE